MMPDGGGFDVYVDGVWAGDGLVSEDGINGCVTRQFRFAADENGGERLTGAIDRVG